MDAPPTPKPAARGLFIVVEGMDRAGKSTQVRRLAAMLAEWAAPTAVHTTSFPDTEYESGRRCRQYLSGELKLDVAEAHALFAANRRDAEPKLRGWLAAGDHVVCDRYAYSGVAYSVAKGMAMDDAKRADAGLLRPDFVFCLCGDAAVLAQRGGYGAEINDSVALQTKVAAAYEALAAAATTSTTPFAMCDAAAPPDETTARILGDIMAYTFKHPLARSGVLW